MNQKHQKKLLIVISLLLILGLAAGLVLYALKQNINLFITPTELLQQASSSTDLNYRLGGYVKKHSIHYNPSGRSVDFIVTDQQHEVLVSYDGILPNLFREGQGVVVTGKLHTNNTFTASTVLAKHDEKYMPPALAKALKIQTERVKP